MSTVLRVGPYRFFFYSSDGREPPHIHVEAGDHTAQFWLTPTALAHQHGFAEHELHEVQQIIEAHHTDLQEAWHALLRPLTN